MHLGRHLNRSSGRQPAWERQSGFTYVAMLFALAIFGIGLGAIGESWSARSHRDKEEELIQIGRAYVHAIAEYYQRSPGTPKSYPKRLTDLVEDMRFVGIERRLRTIYRDPFTHTEQWGLIMAPEGGIMGIYSLSDQTTLRKQPVLVTDALPVVGNTYTEWKFIYKATP